MIDKTRSRRGVLKKLKELNLMFKAPTKKSTAAAASKKNLWRPEEDEELRSLYDQYRLEEDCLQRIIVEFEERRNKQQIIKRMLQLYIIADKSEILPAKQTKRSSKKKRYESDVEENAEDADFMEEPTFSGANADTNQKNKLKKRTVEKKKKEKLASKELKRRNIVRTPLDVGTLRVVILPVVAEKYEEAINWLKECLQEAAEDIEAAAELDDGVPLVPLLEVQKEAMEDADFKKLLVALGLQPPIMGMENYWRIPNYLNAADLSLRAKVVGSEDVDVNIDNNVVMEEEEQEEEEDENEGEENSGDESEEDSLEKRKTTRMNMLMFSKSDEEVEERTPLKVKVLEDKEDENEDEDTTMRKLEKVLHRKRRNPYICSSSSESENEGNKNQKDVTSPAKDITNIFDQLKVKRANIEERKKQNVEQNTEKNSTDDEDIIMLERKLKRKQRPDYLSSDEENENKEEQLDVLFDKLKEKTSEIDEELNFDSENFRKRLEELNEYDLEADIFDKEPQQIDEEEKENYANKKGRRAQIIDSDSENDATTTTEAATAARVHTSNNKRQRSPWSNVSTANDNVDYADINNTITTFTPAAGNKAVNGKRRRIAVIDDDEQDD